MKGLRALWKKPGVKSISVLLAIVFALSACGTTTPSIQ